MAEESSYETQHEEPKTAKKDKKKKHKKSSSIADEPSYETQHEEAEKHTKRKKKSSSKADEPGHDTDEDESNPKKSKRKTLKVKLEAIADCADTTPPVVGYFPSGYNPNSYRAGNKLEVYRHVRHPNRLEAVVRPEGSTVEFVGTSYSGEAAAPQVCTFALGVYDKESKTLKIVPIAANKIMRLEPRVMREKEPELSEGLTEASATGKFERNIQDLSTVYGTRKDKTRDQKYKILNEQKDFELGEGRVFLKNEESEPEVETEETSKPETFRNIPPHNPNADVSEKVYDLDQIIPTDERPYLLDILDDYRSKRTTYPTFVANRMKRLKTMKDEGEKEKLACILTYITHLLAIWERYRPSKSKERTFLKMPTTVRQRLISLFVDSESEVLSSDKNELLIGYILVLTLFADNFKTEPSDIAKDLLTTRPALKVYYHQIGGKYDNKSCVTLPVPLNFPSMRKRGLKRDNNIR